MKRFAVPFVIAGSVAVLIALFVLLRSITSGSAPTPEPPHPPSATATPPSAPEQPTVPHPSGSSSPPPASLAQRIWPHHRASDPKSGDSTPSGSGDRPEDRGDGPPATRFNTKNLQYGLPQIREKIAGNTPQITACVGGAKPTGNATLTFIVAQRAGKVVIEQSDYDREASTLQDEALLDCFAKAATSMQFDGLPREAEAIIVTRVIVLDNGVVTDDRPAKFSYIR